MIVAITTCMGRLSHLQATWPIFARYSQGIPHVLVDYSCPDRCGDWAEANCPDATVVRIGEDRCRRGPDGAPKFHKTQALNAGARAAARMGATSLMFIDADTIVTEEAFTWVRRNLKPNQFLIAQTLREKKDLVGFLVVPVSHYLVVGGFDESIMDWGAEDLDLRVRLFLQAKIGFAEMPTPYLGSIPHPDSDRTARYEVKDTQESNNRNFDRLVRNALLSAPGLSAEQIFRHQPICRLLGGCIVGSPALGGKRR